MVGVILDGTKALPMTAVLILTIYLSVYAVLVQLRMLSIVPEDSKLPRHATTSTATPTSTVPPLGVPHLLLVWRVIIVSVLL